MFLNKTKLKRIIKDAGKRGQLRVGYIYGGLVICNGYLITWTERGYEPNWLKAAVMEAAGRLPEIGELFKVQDDQTSQLEMADNDVMNLPQMYMDSKEAFVVTPVLIESTGSHFRFLQHKQSRNIVAISEHLYDMIDRSELDWNIENPPVGPSARMEQGSLFVWKNEYSAYAITKTDLGTDACSKVIETLSLIKFEGEE